MRGERFAAGERRVDVLLAGDRLRRAVDGAGLGEHLGAAQQRLARHAGPVGALAADQFALDEDGGQPAPHDDVGDVLPRRARPRGRRRRRSAPRWSPAHPGGVVDWPPCPSTPPQFAAALRPVRRRGLPADRAGRHRRRRDDGQLGDERVGRPAAGRRRADRRRLPGRGARGGRPLRADRAGRRSTRSWPAGSPRPGGPAPGTCWSRCRGPAPPAAARSCSPTAWPRWTAGWSGWSRPATTCSPCSRSRPCRCSTRAAARCSGCAAGTSTSRAVRPAATVTGHDRRFADACHIRRPGGALSVWNSYGTAGRDRDRPASGGAVRPNREDGVVAAVDGPGRRPRRPRARSSAATTARVVAVAARVLGSRDEAEDVAQEVFLSFGRSSVPADEAGGWLTVAADPHRPEPAPLRPPSQRPRGAAPSRRRVRPTVVPDVADLVITREERSSVRAALGPAAAQAGRRAGPPAQRPQLRRGRRRPRPCPPAAWAPPCAAPSPSCSRS